LLTLQFFIIIFGLGIIFIKLKIRVMKTKLLTPGILLSISIALISCNKSGNTPKNSNVSLSLPATVAQYYGPDDRRNNIATLGRVLFYDPALSVNSAISCGSCHKQAAGFADNVQFSLGFKNVLTRRNSLSIQDINSQMIPDFTYGDTLFRPGSSLFWDGRENNLGNLIMRPVTNHVEMGIADPSVLPSKLASIPYYANLFNNAFGSSQITPNKISGAIALFINSIQTGNSRFELAFNQGGINTSLLTPVEMQGMQLFENKYNCNSCHQTIGGNGTYNTSFSFMNNGLDVNPTDPGLGALTGNAADMGKFKAPELHNIALTAPYMHDGRFKTLDDVLNFYSNGIQKSQNLDGRLQDSSGNGNPIRFNIPNQDRVALKAFLNSLTDYTMVTDPKFSNPFIYQ